MKRHRPVFPVFFRHIKLLIALEREELLETFSDSSIDHFNNDIKQQVTTGQTKRSEEIYENLSLVGNVFNGIPNSPRS